MPTYSYKCQSCNDSFEVQQSINDGALTLCEKCGGQLKKVLGQIAVTFKGSGFYKTDNSSTKKSD